MASDRAPWEPESAAGPYDPSAGDLAELRELILGAERRRLDALEARLDAGLTSEDVADLLPEAIALRAGRDRQLARALAPTIDGAISESVRRRPREIATAIFPILGPAIRKAIAETLAGLVNSINSTIEHSLSPRGLKWRIEAWRTGVPYAQIVLRHALVYRVEQVFLIHPENGLLLSHASAPDLPASDGDLISGMLTAIRDFVADSFAPEREAGGLRRFSVGELTVMVEQGPRALLAAVVRGQAPDSLLLKLQDTLETIHLQFADPLADFDGDASTLAGAKPLLEECLATVVSTDRMREGKKKAIWLPWAVAAALAIVLFTWMAIRSERRWQQAMGALEAAPGIVLTRAERDGSRWRFDGLKDPLATEPAVLLAGAGVDTSRIEGRWEPYLSLQPELVLARVRQRLTPPATVQLTLTGETVRLTGTAPLAWVAATSRVTTLPAGSAALDLTGLSPVLPPELAALEQEIEGERVQFEVGSSSLDAGGWTIARRVARAFARLETGVAAAGARATLELVGRTDATGTDATNQALSRDRAESVNAALGLGRALVRVNAVGTGDPLGAADPLEQARINRSVSFEVKVTMDSDAGEPAQ